MLAFSSGWYFLWVFIFPRVSFSFWWFLSCGGLSFIFKLVILDKSVFAICCWFMSSICPLFVFSNEATRLGLHYGGGAAPAPASPPDYFEGDQKQQCNPGRYTTLAWHLSSKFGPRTDTTSHAQQTSIERRNLFHSAKGLYSKVAYLF